MCLLGASSFYARAFETGWIAEATLVVQRLIADHDGTAEQLRKAFGFKDAMLIHQAGGCFLHFLSVLQRMSPANSFNDARDRLMDQFMKGFMDADLLHVLSSSVPPGDIKSVGSFRTANCRIFLNTVCLILAPCKLLWLLCSWENIRNCASTFVSLSWRPFVAQIEAAIQNEKDEKEAQLAQKLRQADLESLVSKIESDFALLDNALEPDEKRAQEHALDMKYLRERQQQPDFSTCIYIAVFRVWPLLATTHLSPPWRLDPTL